MKHLHCMMAKDFYDFIKIQNEIDQQVLYSGLVLSLFYERQIQVSKTVKDNLYIQKKLIDPNSNIFWGDSERCFSLPNKTYESLHYDFREYLQTLKPSFNEDKFIYIKFSHESFFTTKCTECINVFICKNRVLIPGKSNLLDFNEIKIITREEYESNI